MKTRTSPSPRLRFRQNGVILVIALIVLVAMTLVAIGTVRSVDTSNVVAGNLAFKQATLNGTDAAVEAGFRWLMNSLGTLDNNNTANGFYSAVPATEPDWSDPGAWAGALCLNSCAPDASGNTGYYIIHRMCTEANTPHNGVNGSTPNSCHVSTPSGSGGGDSHGGAGTGTPTGSSVSLYYRITAKVVGPRNSVSIVQAIVNI